MKSTFIVKIKSRNGKVYEINEQCLEMSEFLKNLASGLTNQEEELYIKEIDDKYLEKIIEYLKHYQYEKPKEIPKPLPSADLKAILSEWDYEFIMTFTLEECIDLVNAANELDINELVNLCSARMAYEMINCPIDEAREKFGVKADDLTEEEIREMDYYPLD